MATTDRLDTDELNTDRTTTDRMGRTVVLGNAVHTGALSITPTIVASAVGAANAAGAMAQAEVSSMDMFNGSIGLWPAGLSATPTAVLTANGVTVIAAAFSVTAASTSTFSSQAVTVAAGNFSIVTASTFTSSGYGFLS